LSKEELFMLNSNKIENSCRFQDTLTKCLFVQDSFPYIGEAYTCIARNPNLLYRLSVSGFANAPKPIEVLFVRRTTCQFLPDLRSIHIKGIHITFSKLSFISDHSLSGVPNLRSLVLSNNAILSVPMKLFESVPNIVHLDLSNNKIAFSNTFEMWLTLPLLSASFENNHCADGTLADDETECDDELKEGVEDYKFIGYCQGKDNITCDFLVAFYDDKYYHPGWDTLQNSAIVDEN
jgi:Leucine-rich repeat (LRR) protein